jgi:adsorption protein A
MRSLILLPIFLFTFNAHAQQSSAINLGSGINSYQRFLIYPRIQKGLSALESGDYERAIEEFSWARKRAPKAPSTAMYLANAYIKSNAYDKAKEVLEQQLEFTPKDQQILKRLTNTLVLEKDYLAASNSLKAELRLNESNVIAQEKLKVVNQELVNLELSRLKILQEEDPAQFLAALKDKKVSFDNAFEERNWIDLLLLDFAKSPELLLSYQPVFDSNRIYQAEKLLKILLTEGRQADADAYIAQLPDSIKLNPVFLDHLSYQLLNENGEHQAIGLLLEAYPFKWTNNSQRIELMDRLILLLKNHSDVIASSYLEKLSTPLDSPELRSLQVKLLSALNDCSAIRQVLGDYSAFYTADDWTRLGYCYGDRLPGLGVLAFERAEELAPSPEHERAIAYQAFSAKSYLRALSAWNSIPLDLMTPADMLSAATTAQALGDKVELKKWLLLYENTDGAKDDLYWWLSAQTKLTSDPQAALIALSKAASIKPSVTYYSQIASLLMTEGKLSEAIEYLNKALLLNPSDSVTQAALGYAYYRQGKYQRAQYYLSASLKARPDDEELVKQLAYTNQKLGQNTQAVKYAEEAIDSFNRYSPSEITPDIKSQQFGMRRMHEDLERRWSFTADAMSGNQVTAAPNIGQPGTNYRSYSQAEAAYRLGNPAIDNGKTLSAYTRIFAGGGSNNSPIPLYAPMIAGGLRWKPLSDYVLNLAIEEQTPLDRGQYTQTSLMLRASASLLNSGIYSDDWHPNGTGWIAQNLYLDAAHYVTSSVTSLVTDYRISYHQKIEEGQTIEPYAHLQWSSLNQANGVDERLGIGARWNIWQGQSTYNAYPSKIMIGLEFQYAFKTYLNDKSAIFLSLGGRW